jgi:aspartate aminotransferase-like enzyme
MRQYGVVVASTIGPVKGKGFRVGHMVNVNQNDIMSTIGGIDRSIALKGEKS